jgi:cytochrome c
MKKTTALLLSLAIASIVHADAPPEANRTPGVQLHVFDVDADQSRLLQLVPGQTPNVSKVVTSLDLRKKEDFGLEDDFLAEVSGWLTIDVPGNYEFELRSDDGSEFYLNDNLFISHDGLHGGNVPKSAGVSLDRGVVAIRLRMFENAGDQQLTLRWKTPGTDEFVNIPADKLFTTSNVVQVTSPGKKKLVPTISPFSPGDGMPLSAVHPSFTLTPVHKEGEFEPRVGGIDFLPDGRMVLCTWDPSGDVYLINTTTGERQKYATGLAEPLGVKVVDGSIYVLQKQELTKLVDSNNDGVADGYLCVSQDWPVTANFHEFAFGLVYKAPFFYANLAVAINPGGRNTEPQTKPNLNDVQRGQVIRIHKDTGKVEPVAMGIRTPNGIGLMASTGDIYLTDNQGDWLPSSKLIKLKDGAFYGAHTNPDHKWKDRPVTPPVAWLPQGEIGNSPSQPAELMVGPWKGQIIHGDVTHGGLKRTFVETIDYTNQEGEPRSVDQGCVFRFSQGFSAGLNRIAWGPDGSLYVGGIGSTGNWGQAGKRRFGLEKLTFTGAPAFEPLAVRAKTNGFEVEFTEPIATDADLEPTHYELKQWRYQPTKEYGGAKQDEQTLWVNSVTPASDRKRVFLHIDGLRDGRVVYLRLPRTLRAESGRKLWTCEAWYTLNRLPRKTDPVDRIGVPSTQPVVHNKLSDEEKAQGWKLLFDGNSTKGWRGYRQEKMPAGWEVVTGTLMRTRGGGDIMTETQFGDFELSLEWKVEQSGNSGIMFRVDESEDVPWKTGIEMQVLDNAGHPDGRNAITSAGSAYALVAPSTDASFGANRWNQARIVAKGTRITMELNGTTTADFDTASDDFQARLKASKFAGLATFATRSSGHIVLQDHGDRVSFRNVKIRPRS